MSAAVTMAPSPAPHDRPSYGSNSAAANANSNTSASAAEMSAASAVSAVSSPSAHRTTSAQRIGSRSPRGGAQSSAAKSSPPSITRLSGQPPKIIVKKEPGSPEPTPRHRPRRLDLSKGGASNSGAPGTGRPMTARDSQLGIQEVGLACLSPGFVTHDPAMKEQLQRSMSVREQQRHIIEARLQQQSAKGDGEIPGRERDGNQFAAKTPGMSRRNKAPPGLSIVAPSHENFANERVIQSAPLGQTFTGMHNPHPLTRHITNQPSKLSNTSHIHHVPANQTNNRLPPIADVFRQGMSAHPDSSGHSLFVQQSNARGPLTSPGHPPVMSHPPPPPPPSHHSHNPAPAHPREYRSAEEAQVDIAGGRPELLPKLVHYGGHQPPTPPSPLNGYASRHQEAPQSTSKRSRTEYEAGEPAHSERPAQRRGPFGEGRDSPDTQNAKRAEFLKLCERAWDLFHS